MSLSLTQQQTVFIAENQAITNNLLRLLALGPSISISGGVGTADLDAGAITAAKATPGAYFYGAVSGTNAYTLTLSPALGAYADGVAVIGKVANANTAAATATLDVDGLGAKNLYNGATGELIKPGDLPANSLVRFVYNSTRNSSAGGWDVREVLPASVIRPATNVTTGTANAQAVVNTPVLTAYAAGVMLLVKVGASLTNTDALTLNCDGLGTRAVTRADGSDLLENDWKAGQTYLLYDDGTQFVILGLVEDTAVVASSRNLVIKNGGTAVSQMDIDADEVVLKTTDGRSFLATAVNVTADMSLGVAVNGLDAGVESADAWYYLWLISDGSTVASLISTSSTAPTMPAGYSYKALVGMVRNTSSDFVVTRIQDRRAWVAQQTINATITGVTSYTAIGGADATAFAVIVPPEAKTARIHLGRVSNNNLTAGLAPDSTGTGEHLAAMAPAGALQVNGMNAVTTGEIPLITPQIFYWKVGTTTANDYKLSCSGFTF